MIGHPFVLFGKLLILFQEDLLEGDYFVEGVDFSEIGKVEVVLSIVVRHFVELKLFVDEL